MGNANWDPHAYSNYSQSISGQSREQIFSSRRLNADLDPSKIKVREARDSQANPESTPIMIFSDVTGSMGELAEIMIRRGLGAIMKELYDHQPVKGPQILCGAIGDSRTDSAPLQATQFEAGVAPMVQQLANIFIEGGGGGNGGESYSLAWAFAAARVESDAWDKRQKKGYLFTIGDESCHLTENEASALAALKLAQERFHVFHIAVRPVGDQAVMANWRKLLGDRVLQCENTDMLPEIIASVIRICEGQDVSTTYTPSVGRVVAKATAHLITAGA